MGDVQSPFMTIIVVYIWSKPQVIYKPHCHYQNFFPLANGLYLIATTNKTPLRNGNCPVTNLITKMGVAHTAGPFCVPEHEPRGYST